LIRALNRQETGDDAEGPEHNLTPTGQGSRFGLRCRHVPTTGFQAHPAGGQAVETTTWLSNTSFTLLPSAAIVKTSPLFEVSLALLMKGCCSLKAIREPSGDQDG